MTSPLGSVLITGPTGGLGRETVLALARRPAAERPDLVLVGRAGRGLDDIAAAARAAGATVAAVPCDLSRLADVRAAGAAVVRLLAEGTVRPLRGLIANAGVTNRDTHRASADGYELTFAVNHLAHAQLTADLLESISAPARVVLIGSNTYHQNLPRRLLHVPPARWRDPAVLARPTAAEAQAAPDAGGVAYSNSKLAAFYYAHELQRRVAAGINVIVFEPGFMPGTGLSRQYGAGLQRAGRVVQRIPGVSSPARSGPLLASIVLDDRWSHLSGGAFVVKDRERPVFPVAVDRDREARLWTATEELLAAARETGG